MRDFNKEIEDAEKLVEILKKERNEYIDKLQFIILKQLEQLPINKFLDIMEKAIKNRVVDTPLTPNEKELNELWKVLKSE